MPGLVLPAPPFGHFLGRPGIPPYSYCKNLHGETGVSTPHTPFRLTHRFASHPVSPHTVSVSIQKMRFQEFHPIRTVKIQTDGETERRRDRQTDSRARVSSLET